MRSGTETSPACKMSSTFTSDVSDEELDLFFQEWVTQSKHLKILVTGQVGSGKSALINSLLRTTDEIPGGQAAKEGDSAASVTSKVGIYAVNKNGVEMVLYDTPGLLDPDINKLDVPTLSKIQKETGGEIDLLLVCKRMGSRLDSGDIRVMQQITEYMGESVWKNAAYILTFANEVRPARRRGAKLPTEEETIDDFARKEKEMEELLREYLHKEGHVTADIANEVPVVPAGYDDPSLPGCSDWYNVLWLTVCSRIKASSQPALLKVVHIPQELRTVVPENQQKSVTGSHSKVSELLLFLRNLTMQVPAIGCKFREWVSNSKHKKD